MYGVFFFDNLVQVKASLRDEGVSLFQSSKKEKEKRVRWLLLPQVEMAEHNSPSFRTQDRAHTNGASIWSS